MATRLISKNKESSDTHNTLEIRQFVVSKMLSIDGFAELEPHQQFEIIDNYVQYIITGEIPNDVTDTN